MKQAIASSPFPPRVELWTLLTTIALATLVFKIQSFDSAILKAPILISGVSVVLAVFLANAIREQRFSVRLTMVHGLVASLFLYNIASAVFPGNPSVRLTTVLLNLTNLVMFFIGAQIFTHRHELTALLKTLVLVTALVSVLGMLQFGLGEKLALDFFLGSDRRVTSTLGNSAFLSGYLALLLPALVAFAISESATGRWKAVAFLAVALSALVLLLTQTRTSIIGASVGLLLLALLLRGPRLRTVLWGALIVGIGFTVVFFFLPDLADRFTRMFAGGRASSFARRLVFWEGGLNAFLSAPVFGHGLGSFEQTVIRFRSPDYWIVGSEDLIPHAHNEFIELAVDLGAIGLLLVLGIWFVVFRNGFRVLDSAKRWERLNALGLICSLVAIAVDATSNVALRHVPIAALTYLFMGILVSRVWEKTEREDDALTDPGPRWLWFVPPAAVVVLLAFYWSTMPAILRSDSLTINGILAGSKGQKQAAVEQFRSAIREDPLNLTARSALGVELVHLKRADETLDAMKELRRIAPTYPKANLMEAWALATMKRYPEALEAIGHELQFRTHPDAYIILSRIYAGMRDTTKERAALEMVLNKSIEGNTTGSLSYAGQRLIALIASLSEAQRLRPLFESLERKFSNEEIVLRCLGELYVKLGDGPNAERIAKRLNITAGQGK